MQFLYSIFSKSSTTNWTSPKSSTALEFLGRIDGSLSSICKDFNHLHHVSVGNWYKIHYIFTFPHIQPVEQIRPIQIPLVTQPISSLAVKCPQGIPQAPGDQQAPFLIGLITQGTRWSAATIRPLLLDKLADCLGLPQHAWGPFQYKENSYTGKVASLYQPHHFSGFYCLCNTRWYLSISCIII